MKCYFCVAAALFVVHSVAISSALAQQRVLGLDVSAWQGNISQTTWNNIYNLENRDFVFIRASRGGTTGEDHRQGGYPAADNDFFNLSQRYDDPYYVQNITQATMAGMLAGSYHFGRHDVVGNTGTDEANHFMQMAGPWMRPGYMLPVYDLEGPNPLTADQLAQFGIDFSDRIHEVMGIRPIMYINGVYSSTLQSASPAMRNQVVTAFPHLWDARYAYQAPNYNSPEVQTAHPKDTASTFYGPWDDSGITHPWSFWQYASTGRLQSFNNGGSNLDFNVAQGGIEFVKDRLVPALWMSDQSGDWTALDKWNSGQTPVAPVQGPGQLARVGPLTLPTPRLPGVDDTLRNVQGENDTVILDRPNDDITVTHSSGTHNIRKLFAREALDITGGTLMINYIPSPDSTPISAQFSAPVSLGGSGNLSVHTLQVDSTRTFTLAGGSLAFNTLNLMRHNVTPATILMTGDVSFSPLANATATIANGAPAGSSGTVDLAGGERTFHVADGTAAVDVAINVPITNGALTKAGAGTLALGGANTYAGDTTVEQGTLRLATPVLSDSADVYVSNAGLLELTFGSSPDIIDSLFLDGVFQPGGVWGAVGSGAQFTSPFITGTGMLKVTGLPGDYTGDGLVDAADYVVWRDNFGSATPLPNDDTPGVAQDDYDRWRAHFGDTINNGAGSSTGAAVPEPTSLALIVVGLVMLVRRRK